MLNQLLQICVHYSLVLAHCLVDSKPLTFRLLQVKAREHKTLFIFLNLRAVVLKKTLIWSFLNISHRMGIHAFFKKLSWPRSSVFFHTVLHCSCRLEQQSSWHSFCPESVLKGRKSLGGIMPAELSYFTPLCSLQYEICVRWHLGEQGEGKKMSRVNPRVKQGFVYFAAFEHTLEQPWGGW